MKIARNVKTADFMKTAVTVHTKTLHLDLTSYLVANMKKSHTIRQKLLLAARDLQFPEVLKFCK
jgi:hypothetical protein